MTIIIVYNFISNIDYYHYYYYCLLIFPPKLKLWLCPALSCLVKVQIWWVCSCAPKRTRFQSYYTCKTYPSE